MAQLRSASMTVLAVALSAVLVLAGSTASARADANLDADGNVAPVYAGGAVTLDDPTYSTTDQTIANVKGRNAAVQALAGTLKISTEKAYARLAAELDASQRGAQVQRMVGAAAAGHYVDGHGRAVVNVTTDEAARTAGQAGVTVRVVDRSLIELERIKEQLDQLAQQNGAGQVQSWGIDVVHDQVHVITRDSDDPQTADFLQAARSSDAVRVTTTTARMITTAGLLGGQPLDAGNTACSLGFNAQDSAGNPVLLTAGHCAVGYATFTNGGVEVATTTDYTFPGTGDYAEAPIGNSGYWSARGAVSGPHGVQSVGGSAAMAVGAAICQRGRATGWTCGTIQSIDNTVNYNNDDGSNSMVAGLIETNACSEESDSGGANLSGDQAQGLTSGAAGYDNDRNPLTPPVCGSKVHQPDISWVQPIGVPLAAYGLRLITEP